MNRILAAAVTAVLIFSLSACAGGSESGEQTDEAVSSPETSGTAEETSLPDTWYDFSDEQPVLDDSGDAETTDIKKVYAGYDDNYIYVAFEVDTEDIDSTTMIHGGTCIFVIIDTPDYFMVTDVDETVYADIDGNGEYYGQAAYEYQDGLLQIRVPLSIYGGATEFAIDTVFRENSEGDKVVADEVDEFQYFIG